MSETDESPTSSDETLIANARLGDQNAFAELWRRHYRSGARVASQFTSSIDADDLVSEAYTRIYQRVLAGGGPSGAFRPYLYTTIRNLASSWGAASRDVQVDDIQDFEDPASLDDPASIALDRTLTARAFRSLPERWQSVLWYTEVEGMDPHEVAPLLGMSANGVAALSYRAREGLRKAWLQAHVSQPGASDACKWTMSRLGEAARHSLTAREQERIKEHLLGCAKCAIVSEEVEEVGSHLAMVLLPILLGGVVGGALLATLGQAGTAAAAGVIPAIPASFSVLSTPAAFVPATVTPAVASGLALGSATGVSAIVGGLAVVVTLGGGVALGLVPAAPTPVHQISASAPSHQSTSQGDTSSGSTDPLLGAVPIATPTDPSDVGGALGRLDDTVGTLVKGVKKKVIDPVLGALTPPAAGPGHTGSSAPSAPATIALHLAGIGTPKATVTARIGGVVYGTATVKADRSWTLKLSKVPADAKTVQLKQSLTVLGIKLPIDIPLKLSTGGLKLVVQLLN